MRAGPENLTNQEAPMSAFELWDKIPFGFHRVGIKAVLLDPGLRGMTERREFSC